MGVLSITADKYFPGSYGQSAVIGVGVRSAEQRRIEQRLSGGRKLGDERSELTIDQKFGLIPGCGGRIVVLSRRRKRARLSVSRAGDIDVAGCIQRDLRRKLSRRAA